MAEDFTWFACDPSDELKRIFEAMREDRMRGIQKYRHETMQELATNVTAQDYARGLHVACHFAQALALRDGNGLDGVIQSLYADRPKRKPFFLSDFIAGESIARNGRNGLDIGTDSVTIRYSNGDYSISYSGMSYLTALLEFSMNAFGYVEFAEYLRPICRDDVSRKEVSDTSLALSRGLYTYLRDHLPAVQTQRRSEAVRKFIEKRVGGDFSDDDITDDLILAFWRAHSAGSDGSDFKTFVSVANAFAEFRTRMQDREQAGRFARAAGLGADFEAGEIDLDTLGNQEWETGDESASPLAILESPPVDSVKFLNNRETALAAILLEGRENLRIHPMSFMRSAVFRKIQFRITQGLRKKIDAEALLALIEEADQYGYGDFLQSIDDLAVHLDKVTLASLYVLTMEAAASGGPATSLDFAQMQKAKKSFHGISRQGFTDGDLKDPDILLAHRIGAGALTEIRKAVIETRDYLVKTNDWDDRFRSDAEVFKTQLLKIYGGQ